MFVLLRHLCPLCRMDHYARQFQLSSYTQTWPLADAMCMGPRSFSIVLSLSAPLSQSRLTLSMHPLEDAKIRALAPVSSVASGQAPFCRRAAITPVLAVLHSLHRRSGLPHPSKYTYLECSHGGLSKANELSFSPRLCDVRAHLRETHSHEPLRISTDNSIRLYSIDNSVRMYSTDNSLVDHSR